MGSEMCIRDRRGTVGSGEIISVDSRLLSLSDASELSEEEDVQVTPTLFD